MDETSTPSTGGRSRRRRNVIGTSPHRDEYARLLRAGWSSLALERYAAFRYGEDIPAPTFRSYRKRLESEKVSQAPDAWKIDTDDTMDVIGLRADLIRLQVNRIGIDAKHEQNMGKLFGTLGREITILDSLIDSHKADLQDIGVMPKSPDEILLSTRQAGPSGADSPRHQTLGALIGATGASPEAQAMLARSLHLATSNGERVDEQQPPAQTG